MLRAGPFSDERVSGLINRRFVPFYFDLNTSGFAGDADAREFVVAQKEELGGASVPTPPVLVMNAAGDVIAEVSNYADEDTLLSTLLGALAEHPEYARPDPGEKDLAPLARARLLMDLGDHAGAAKILDGQSGVEAALLAAKLARWRGDPQALERAIRSLDGADVAADRSLELAHLAWMRGSVVEQEKLLRGFPEDHPRRTEARYYHGLALFHQGEVEGAKAVWQATIEACAQDPWIYRADWAHSQAGAEEKRQFFAGGSSTLLGRIGYMGRRNPDLAPRSKGYPK